MENENEIYKLKKTEAINPKRRGGINKHKGGRKLYT